MSARFASSAFDGEGARLYGGRWNSPGVAMVYTADSASLAALEVLTGLNDSAFLSDFVLIPVSIPDTAMRKLNTKLLPANWQSLPAPPELSILGDTWLKEKTSPVLRVPSALIKQQFNYLLNPQHAAFSLLTFGAPESFSFDERLLPKA